MKDINVMISMILVMFLIKMGDCQLLGAGVGVGSCRAFPYRAQQVLMLLTCFILISLILKVDWEVCPEEVSCCNEYGYCKTREEWEAKQFRDCNGVSNGIDTSE